MNIEILENLWPKQYQQLLAKYEYDKIQVHNIQKLNKTFLQLKKVYQYQQDNNSTLRQAIVNLGLMKSRATLYQYHQKLRNVANEKNLLDILLKPTGPKTIKYVYDQDYRQLIADAYYNLHMAKTNIYISFKRKFFPKLAYNTVLKIIRQDARNKQKIKRVIIKHPLRTYNISFGNLQMDLKIIGPKESPTGQRITIFDAKDEQSKLYYMQVIKSQTKDNLIEATYNMIDYFQNFLCLPIKRIRTDNAMVFKKNNFVSSYEFDSLLKLYNIKHEKIPLGQPQCNGVIERQHKILDHEFLPLIKKFQTLKSIQNQAKLFMQNFNFNREHYYTFLQKCSDYKTFESRFQTPINFYNIKA